MGFEWLLENWVFLVGFLLECGWLVLISWAGKISRAGPVRDAPREWFAAVGKFHGVEENWFGDDDSAFFWGG
jgi:hypothetical protein